MNDNEDLTQRRLGNVSHALSAVYLAQILENNANASWENQHTMKMTLWQYFTGFMGTFGFIGLTVFSLDDAGNLWWGEWSTQVMVVWFVFWMWLCLYGVRWFKNKPENNPNGYMVGGEYSAGYNPEYSAGFNPEYSAGYNPEYAGGREVDEYGNYVLPEEDEDTVELPAPGFDPRVSGWYYGPDPSGRQPWDR